MQQTCGRGASQHSDGSSATALVQHLLMTTLSQLTGSRSAQLARLQVSSGSGFFWQIQMKIKALALSQCYLEA